MITYSIIIPVYNEEANLPEMYRRVVQVIEELDGPAELVLIDDGSQDRSLAILDELHQRDPRVHYLSLARNFGHQIAVTAGLQYAQGEAVIIMDADLQDPPELVPQLIEKWRAGYHVVYAQRVSRAKESRFKKLMAYGFYRILNRFTDVTIPTDTGDFCLMSRQVVDILNSMPEKHRYIRGLRAWVGFPQTAVRFNREPRFAGDVKYTFRKSLKLAIDGIISLSRKPLKIATYLGLVTALVAIAMMILVLFWRIYNAPAQLIGYTLITIAIFFLGAVQLICLGILGEYIGRIYDEVKQRPLYTVKKAAGFDEVL
ncbi:glycosyltransferase family 2 protein [Picosynechococcus sp. PCC 11901]|uniref:glycosyltransferase family 2 protein n=1 Tax=Picosynechococcus sp. PCC 11901 TaxID=2579791 RepID=UPI0010FC1475|nr:glycosyltransferase family 2 protein [Picosynechococcus sp. PCC 11901]QCS49378.1 glycosyltransferase family 2 protein [Picosynechococcus sp. PCC 11901]